MLVTSSPRPLYESTHTDQLTLRSNIEVDILHYRTQRKEAKPDDGGKCSFTPPIQSSILRASLNIDLNIDGRTREECAPPVVYSRDVSHPSASPLFGAHDIPPSQGPRKE